MQVSFAHSQLIKVWFTNKELSIYIVARYVKDYKYAWPAPAGPTHSNIFLGKSVF